MPFFLKLRTFSKNENPETWQLFLRSEIIFTTKIFPKAIAESISQILPLRPHPISRPLKLDPLFLPKSLGKPVDSKTDEFSESGQSCSLPAAYQSGRNTISNISGNCWELVINVLRVIWIFTLYWGRRFSPRLWVRLDRPHCKCTFPPTSLPT